jgi:hypothetical protein
MCAEFTSGQEKAALMPRDSGAPCLNIYRVNIYKPQWTKENGGVWVVTRILVIVLLFSLGCQYAP